MKSFTLMALLGATQATTGTCATDGTDCSFAKCNKEDTATKKWSPHAFAKTEGATADLKKAYNACKDHITASAYCLNNAASATKTVAEQCTFDICNKETAKDSGKWEVSYKSTDTDAKTACASLVTAEAYCTRNKNDSDGNSRCTFDLCNTEDSTTHKWSAKYTTKGDSKTACTNFVTEKAYCRNNAASATKTVADQCNFDNCNDSTTANKKTTWKAATLGVTATPTSQCASYTSPVAYCSNNALDSAGNSQCNWDNCNS